LRLNSIIGGRGMRSIICNGLVAVLACVAAPCIASAKADDCKVALLATVPVTMNGLRAIVDAKVNGTPSRFILDSGAFFNTMPLAKAAELGLKTGPAPSWLTMRGLGGTFEVKLAKIKSFGFFGINIPDVEFLVGGTDVGTGLIASNFLGIADNEFDLANGQIKLMKPKDCGDKNLAYWTNGAGGNFVSLDDAANPMDKRIFAAVYVNGVRMRALLDTGAPTSFLSRKAAESAGIDLASDKVREEDEVGGLGRRSYRSWVAPVTSFKIGDEEIQKTRLRVIDSRIDTDADATHMVLGMDFYLSHRIYIARGQRKIYFTYAGGKVFSLTTQPQNSTSPAPTPSQPSASPPETAPKDAAAFAQRGNARISRHEIVAGIADLTEAIRMAPDKADYYFDRARAYSANRQPFLAMADLDKTLQIDPRRTQALMARAMGRMSGRDRSGALADLEAAEKSAPEGSMYALGIATFYDQLELPARSIPLLDSWLKLHPNDSRLDEALNSRCWARTRANIEPAKALEDCNAAIRKGGEKPQYFDSRGLAKLRLGDNAGAIADYDQALAKIPKLPWSLLGRGIARLRLGQTEAGNADIAAANAVSPDIEQAAARVGFTRP
jgi:tetratricopeptide (TPR) repeat protein